MTNAAGRPTCRRDAQRGSGTVWGIVAITVLIAATSTIVAVGSAVAARHRAAAAADLAALAAAHAAARGGAAPCAQASSVAAANGAHLSACSTASGIADVTVRRSLPAPFDRLGVTMRARAGPSTSSGAPR
jgi:secretion/DNA translocation related TadE-like protein